LFKWVHDFDGTNLRMTEIQAAVGIEQLKKLPNMVKRRFYNLKTLRKKINNEKIFVPNYPKNIIHAGYRFYFFVKEKKNRNKLVEYLNKNRIDANQGSCPEIYKENRFKKIKKYKILKNANFVGQSVISIPSHHLLSNKNISYIAKIINKF